MPSAPAPGVLLVDDDELLLNSLVRTLRSGRRPVHTATNATRALAVLGEHRIGVIVCEPRDNTLAAFLIDARSQYANATRIILTGYPDMGSVLKAVNEAYPFKLLTKPWIDEELVAMVELGFEQYGLHFRRDHLIEDYTAIRTHSERAHALRALDGFLLAAHPGMSLEMVDELPVGALVLQNGRVIQLNPAGRRMLTASGMAIPQQDQAVADLPPELASLVYAALVAPPLRRTSVRPAARWRLDFFTTDADVGTLIAFALQAELDRPAS